MNAAAEQTEQLSISGSTARRVRIFFVRCLIIAIVAGLTFTSLELVLDKYYSEGQSQNWTVFHPERGWALVPGDYFYKPPRDLHRIAIHIDSRGFRSSPDAVERPESKKVMVLGDSFVFARETSLEDSFPQRVEDLLNQRVAKGVNVWNAGIPAYGTAQELLLVRELFQKRKLKADVYLLMFFTNDTLDNLCLSYGDMQFEPVRPCFTLDAAGKPVLTKLPQNLPDYADDELAPAQNSQFGMRTITIARSWAEERLQTEGRLIQILSRFGFSPQIWRMPGVLNAWYHDKVIQDGLPLTAALIAEMKQEIGQQGGQLIISMVPSAFQMYPDTYVPLLQKSFPGNLLVERFASDVLKPQRIMKDMCLKLGVPFLDLLPPLAEHRDIPLFIPRDGHLTPEGHKLASEALFPFVLEHLPKEGQPANQTQQDAVSNPD